ncbi:MULTISPECIES: CHRD domain-containing protein [unclassified Streptomyces]|uniref:CHRD domain-containing protein n=1 Tax=unclassified Streptomyces TaxID=2593676 RepID=UPI0022533417|nr:MULTISPECIES: CHRD domain-containing protein [unclassified Streptomyces]MCX4989175.1 CHRD domain-containing protein [Streptomyces sp. NBC_00568]MCX5005604.1 CHRD domain-containing protein [Streptomyces sp. NBC_00638]
MGSNATFTTRRKSLILTGVAVAAAAGVAAAVIPAVAADHGGHGGKNATSHSENSGTNHSGHDDSTIVTQHGVMGGTGGTILAASLRGAAEVPVQGGPAVGDKDGAALEFIKVKGDKVSVAVTWRGTGRPTLLHIHQGAKGANGGVKVDSGKLLDRIKGHSVVGTVKVEDAALLDALKTDPGSFYANLHTAEFPGGAVRGQLHKVTSTFDFGNALHNFQASVVKGRQIYECKPAEGGGYAFAQRDVAARLGGHIAHSFVKPNSGTPQWVAPDRSAVTGALIAKTPNGATNIPELDLRATQSGRHHGLLAGTQEILRLNTVGGVAPAGSCSPGTIVGVPYQADYVFVQR